MKHEDMSPNARGMPGLAHLDVLLRDGEREAHADAIAEEVPIALEYNGVSHAVMFATPSDLEDFARGFTLSEGIVATPWQIYDVEIAEVTARGIRVAIEIASECFALLKDRRRALTGRTGCGLCGTESLDHAVRALAPLADGVTLPIATLIAAQEAMHKRQALMHATGAVHAAGFVDRAGQLVDVREDIGRHNALDKLFGALIARGVDLTEGAALITSRASFEMVQKSVTLGVPILAAVSAPTALAVRIAREANLTLLGFVRGGHYCCYSVPARLHEHALRSIVQQVPA
jgi:FdhD protein